MSEETLILRSPTAGLWVRLLAQFIAYWLGYLCFIFVISGFMSDVLVWRIVALPAFAFVGYSTYRMLKNHPVTWPKQVEFDFALRQIQLIDRAHNSKTEGILDAPSQTISFSEIDYLHSEPHMGVILGSVYRLSAVYGDHKIKLVAMNSPKDYMRLLMYCNRSGLEVRKSKLRRI